MYEVVLIHDYELIIEPKFKVYHILYSSNCNTLENIYNLCYNSKVHIIPQYPYRILWLLCWANCGSMLFSLSFRHF